MHIIRQVFKERQFYIPIFSDPVCYSAYFPIKDNTKIRAVLKFYKKEKQKFIINTFAYKYSHL